MNQSTFPLIIGLTLSIACGAYLARNLIPRFAWIVGWSSGLLASFTFIVMVGFDTFQPALPGSLQDLAMPAPTVRTTAYWVAFWLHVAIGTTGAAYCASKLMPPVSHRCVQDEL